MKRIVATIVAGCAITTAFHAQSAAQTSYPHWLLRANTISKDVSSLSVQDTGGSFVVLLYGKSFRDDVTPFKPFENVTAEVWLLRHDGTAQQADKNPPAKLGVANAGSAVEIMSFGFTRSSPQDLAAVVVSVNGEMFVRKIE